MLVVALIIARLLAYPTLIQAVEGNNFNRDSHFKWTAIYTN